VIASQFAKVERNFFNGGTVVGVFRFGQFHSSGQAINRSAVWKRNPVSDNPRNQPTPRPDERRGQDRLTPASLTNRRNLIAAALLLGLTELFGGSAQYLFGRGVILVIRRVAHPAIRWPRTIRLA